MKKILAVLHTYNEKLGQYFSGTALGQILSAIILAAAVACASSIADGIKDERVEAEFYSNISVGNAQEYVEDTLGHPVYKKVWDEYGFIECNYITKHALIRVFYDNNIVKGFFITSKDKSYKKILTTDKTLEVKPLGTFTYKAIAGSPDEVRSYQDYLEEFTYYMETYYEPGIEGYSSLYGYSNYYGFDSNVYTSEGDFRNDEELQGLDDSFINLVNEEVRNEQLLFIDRNKSYPNTYGKCAMEDARIFEKLIINSINY